MGQYMDTSGEKPGLKDSKMKRFPYRKIPTTMNE
jgi:hypothetical protein